MTAEFNTSLYRSIVILYEITNIGWKPSEMKSVNQTGWKWIPIIHYSDIKRLPKPTISLHDPPKPPVIGKTTAFLFK